MVLLYAWLLADFISGLVHWAEDRVLLNETRFKFLNQIKADNDLHHKRPAALTQFSLWENINTSAYFAWPLALVLLLAGAPNVITLAVFFASFGNAVHRYAHMPKAKVPRLIRLFQRTGFFISFDHHTRHHFDENGRIEKEDTTIRYCPMSNWVNPILDKVRFFYFLEWAIRGTK
jgi:hypothetical protein